MRQSRFLERLFDRTAAKRTVSLTLNSDLVAKAKEAGLKLSQISEEALAAALTAYWREQVRAEAEQDVAACDAYVEEHGSPTESLRAHLAEFDAEQDAV